MGEHPTVIEILDFRGGGAEGESARMTGGHIAGCDRCHAIYLGAIYLERQIAEAFPEGVPGTSCPEDWELAAVIAGETGDDVGIRISSHLERCHSCIDRSARYQKALEAVPTGLKAPELWRYAAVKALQDAPDEALEIRSGFPGRLLEFLRGLTATLPPLPGYAAAVAGLVLLAILYTGDRKVAIIIPSTEKVIYREAEPNGALGFMGDEASRPSAKSMDLRISGDTLVFRWDPPPKYARTSFSLIERHGGSILWSQANVTGTEVALPGNLFLEDELYAWLIEVALPDGRKIEFTGDFLYRK